MAIGIAAGCFVVALAIGYVLCSVLNKRKKQKATANSSVEVIPTKQVAITEKAEPKAVNSTANNDSSKKKEPEVAVKEEETVADEKTSIEDSDNAPKQDESADNNDASEANADGGESDQ